MLLKHHLHFCLRWSAISLITILMGAETFGQALEIGPSLTFVGNPLLNQFPVGSVNSASRNIADLKNYAGHLWIANGSSASGAPFDLYALRLSDQQFVRMQQNFPQEEIREFREFNSRLYVASPDEANGGRPNVHVIDGLTITKYDVFAPGGWLPGAHNEDVFAANNGQTLFFPMAINDPSPSNTLISTNGGVSWRFATGMPAGGIGPARFIPFRGTMYASKLASSFNYSTETDFLYKYTPTGATDFVKVYANPQSAGFSGTQPVAFNLFANVPLVEFAGDLYVISSNRLWRYTQMEPTVQVAEILLLTPFPANARVQDSFVHNGQLYVLVNEVIGSSTAQRHRATVFRSINGQQFTALYTFTTATNNAVKAFARTADAFYFGYGLSYDSSAATTPETGNIYRLAVESDGTSGLPPAPPLPVETAPPYFLDDFEANRLVPFGASGSGTTGTRIDYDTADADLELKINRTSNSAFSALVAGTFTRNGAPLAALRDGTTMSARVIGKASASSANFTLRWVVSTDAWTSGSGTYRTFGTTTVSATANTNTLFTLNLATNPSISAAAANYIAGNGTFFQIVIDNSGSPLFSGVIEFGLDDILIGTPAPTVFPAAPTGFTAVAVQGGVLCTWTPLNVASTGFILERSTGGGAYVQVGSYSGLASGTTDIGLLPGTNYTYRIRTYNTTYSPPVTATATSDTAMESWRRLNFGSPLSVGNAANNADPDRDGIVNLMEYALEANPKVSDVAALPQTGLQNNKLTLTFRRARNDLQYTVQGSSDLTIWTDIETTLGTMNVNATVEDTVSTSPRFLRLRVMPTP